jgi:hypothetical protein
MTAAPAMAKDLVLSVGIAPDSVEDANALVERTAEILRSDSNGHGSSVSFSPATGTLIVLGASDAASERISSFVAELDAILGRQAALRFVAIEIIPGQPERKEPILDEPGKRVRRGTTPEAVIAALSKNAVIVPIGDVSAVARNGRPGKTAILSSIGNKAAENEGGRKTSQPESGNSRVVEADFKVRIDGNEILVDHRVSARRNDQVLDFAGNISIPNGGVVVISSPPDSKGRRMVILVSAAELIAKTR